jgi:hypothetical protein
MADERDSVRLRVFRQAFKDAQQVKVTAGSWARGFLNGIGRRDVRRSAA